MDFRNSRAKVRGIRNNNPGNLIKTGNKWRGKVPFSENNDSRFEQFISVEYGIRAMMKNIITLFKRGHNSIDSLINKWAPAFENNTERYSSFVSNQTGIDKTQTIKKLDKKTLIALSMAIAEMENAPENKLIPNESYEKAFYMIGANLIPVTLKKKAQS